MVRPQIPLSKAWLAVVFVATLACGPVTQVPFVTTSEHSPTGTSPADRTISVAIRVEPDSLATRPILSGAFASFALSRRAFNAELTLIDDRGVSRPYLAEELPVLNAATWQVFPDGRMETTWRLRAGLTWHDGTPLTAEDFAFAWRVYSTPDFGAANSQLLRAIDSITVPDERTLVIQWGRPYPNADDLSGTDGLPPLPRHVLESTFQQNEPGVFARNPFWTRDYIGLGPYRLEQWDPGAYLQGLAFEGHAVGRARINRIRINIVTDSSTALANLLAGELDMAVDNAINLEQAVNLNRTWTQTGAGRVLYSSLTWQATVFQLRPELVTPRSLLDVRVRKALAHAVDKQGFAQALYQGEIETAEFLISPRSKWGPAVEGAVRTYPLDLRRTDQLMIEVGYARGNDGVFTNTIDGRFRAELKIVSGREQEVAIMASDWRQAGFEIQEAILPARLSIDPASRVTFPAMFTAITGQGERALGNFITAQIPRAENNWRTGANRGGWSNPEYDRLFEAFTTTLVPDQRGAQLAEMARIFSDELPAISLLFPGIPYAFKAGVQGLMPVTAEGLISWNIHHWELR